MSSKQKIVVGPSLFGETDKNPFEQTTPASGRNTQEYRMLALDVATITGWCTKTASGVWKLAPKKDESKGMRLIRFKAKLKEICEMEEIKLIVFEMPAIAGKFPNFVGMEMMGVLKLFCEENGINHTGYPPKRLKKEVTGNGNASKNDMIEYCKNHYGIDPETDDEADAVCLYHYAIKDLQL
jgi:Holliday junction resolvasome RuvABC endonuclease subunit